MFKMLKDLILGKSKQQRKEKGITKLTRSLNKNIKLLEAIFCDDETVKFRRFETSDEIKCCLVFVDGMVDKDILNRGVLRRIMNCQMSSKINPDKLMEFFSEKIIATEELKKVDDFDDFVYEILYGDTLLLVDGATEGILIDTKGWVMRSIVEPESESVVRGPREGFIESINVNITLIRRKIKDPNLKFQFKYFGKRTRTKICICYIKGLAQERVIQELLERLQRIEIDGILETGYIEEFIRDSPFSPFRTIGYTERPDIVVAKLLEGRVALLCDGTPFVLTFPYLFLENFQANEDYYKNFIFASIDRIMRYTAYFFTTSTPAIYVALVTFHQEMIPTPLLLSISASREGVPFPTIFEAIVLGLFFELLREGGIRLPTPIGQAVSIVGAIILGDAAVSAKLVSAPIIIITALTGISSFLVPKVFGSVLLIRLTLILLSAVFGLYGYMFGVLGIFIHLMSIRSFGVPYMSSLGSLQAQDLKDTMIRAPWWYMYLRPILIGKLNIERQPTEDLRRDVNDVDQK